MSDAALEARCRDLLAGYRQKGRRLATAESCTGGMIAAALTDIAGASDVLERGFITYSNEAKMEMLDVSPEILADFGAVSAETATAMAAGALAHARAEVAVSVTGVAGPGGGSSDKPVGLVYIGLCRRGSPPSAERHIFAGSRGEIRKAAALAALDCLAQALEE